MRSCPNVVICVAIVVTTRNAFAQNACPSRPQFAFQVQKEAHELPRDEGGRIDERTELAPGTKSGVNVVQFVVDTLGKPVTASLKPLSLKDSAIFLAFQRSLATRRFEPAVAREGCKVPQIIQAEVVWVNRSTP